MLNKIDGYTPQYVQTLDKDGNVTGKNQYIRKCEETKPARTFQDELLLSANSKRSDVADLSHIESEGYSYKSGDAEQDKLIQMGMKYKQTCFDFTNSTDFYKISAEQKANGFDEMSNSEKYKVIYEKYQHCYGDNFLDAEAIDYVNPPLPEDEYLSIVRRFHDEVNEACGGASQAKQARKTALYGDMSDEQIRQVIMENYSSESGMTQRNLFRAANEMDLCGIDGEMKAMLNPIGNPFIYKDYANNENSIIVREKQLDMPVSSQYLNDLKSVADNRVLIGGYINPIFTSILNELYLNLQ